MDMILHYVRIGHFVNVLQHPCAHDQIALDKPTRGAFLRTGQRLEV
jgi:hypothetical protein